MILGMKVGPDKQSLLDLAQTNAPFAEVWFNIARIDEYTELFDALKARRMQVGLHFWGVLDGGISPGFGYPDHAILEGSEKLVKKTIDIAARNAFQYVNIHPGNRAIVKMDLDRMDYPYVSEPIPLSRAEPIFLAEMVKLNEYAASKGILLTVETVCRRVQKTEMSGSLPNPTVGIQRTIF